MLCRGERGDWWAQAPVLARPAAQLLQEGLQDMDIHGLGNGGFLTRALTLKFSLSRRLMNSWLYCRESAGMLIARCSILHSTRQGRHQKEDGQWW